MAKPIKESISMNELSDKELKEQVLQKFKKDQTKAEVKKYKFPTEIVDLPSKGKLYPKDNPLSKGQVEMKYMTAKEEDILSSANLIKKGVVIDKLLQSLIVSNINYDDILIGDRNALILAARILGYGKDYKVNVICPTCEHVSVEDIDINEFEEKQIDIPNQNLFEFELPVSKRLIKFKLLNAGDISKIDKEVEAAQQLEPDIDHRPSLSLKKQIVLVDNNEEIDISDFVDFELFARDSKPLKEKIQEVTPDIDLSFNHKCKKCNAESRLYVNLNVDFFWPGV